MCGGDKTKMSVITRKEAIKQAQENKIMQTICDGCCFCVPLDKDSDNNLNDYCLADRLEVIESEGGEVYSIIDESAADEPNITKAVNGRVCTMMRNQDWKEIKTSKGIDENDLVKEARKEIEVSCSFLIYMGAKEGVSAEDRLDNLFKTMRSAENGKSSPGHFFVINNAGIKAYTMLSYLRNRMKYIKTKWNMEYILDNSVKDCEEQEAINKCVDLVYKNITNHYYCIFKDGDIVPHNYISSIDEAINDHMKRFLVLEPKNGEASGTFVVKFAHKQFKGNRGGDLISKIRSKTKEQKCQEMALPLESIVKDQ